MTNVNVGRVVACLVLISGPAIRDVLAVNSLSIGADSARDFGETVSLPLFASFDDPTQGLVMVFQWDGRKGLGEDLFLNNDAGQIFDGADMILSRIEDDYMIFAVLMDLVGDDDPVIPPGQDQQIGTADVTCVCRGPRVEVTVALLHRSFKSLVPGGHVLDNMLIVDGFSVRMDDGLQLNNGMFVCNSEEEPVEEPEVACGDVDDDGNFLPVEGAVGESVSVCFLYRSPVTDEPTERIQGLQLSVSYDCNLQCDPTSLDTTGGVLDEVVPDFLEIQCDNIPADDPADDDDCEMIAGILIEAVPPFEGETLPGTDVFRRLFCLDFTIGPNAECGSTLPLEFVNGLDGNDIIPIANVAAINNQDVLLATMNCSVEVAGTLGEPEFIRGDCDFNGTTNVADGAAMVSHMFVMGEERFDAPCLDACDADDSGELDITDPIFILSWLFIDGSPRPPLPGPVSPGPDPTVDPLDCAAGPGGGDCPGN